MLLAQESGFEDLKTARTDPDLAALREDKRFEGLLGRFLPQASSSGGLLAWLQYQLDFKNSAISRSGAPARSVGCTPLSISPPLRCLPRGRPPPSPLPPQLGSAV